MYYYIYKITCTNGSFKDKFYFGQHTTENLDDNYKGTGALIKKYYKKYPDDYIKEIICYCNSPEELNKKEYDIIHPYLGDTNCLNLRDGGNCGTCSKEVKLKMSEALKKLYKEHPEIIERMKETKRLNKRPVSEETKKKMSDKRKGDLNPMYGKSIKDYMSEENFDEWRKKTIRFS